MITQIKNAEIEKEKQNHNIEIAFKNAGKINIEVPIDNVNTDSKHS